MENNRAVITGVTFFPIVTNYGFWLTTKSLINYDSKVSGDLFEKLSLEKNDTLIGENNVYLHATLNWNTDSIFQEIDLRKQPLATFFLREIESWNQEFVLGFLRGLSQVWLKSVRDKVKEEGRHADQNMKERIQEKIYEQCASVDKKKIDAYLKYSQECLHIVQFFEAKYGGITFPPTHLIHRN